MAKCVEIRWAVTPFRSDEFVEAWAPYAAAAVDFGASGFALYRSLEDSQLVTQHAYFDNKDDWDAYWNSERLIKGRQEILGLHSVPVLYNWYEIVADGVVSEV